MFDKTVALVSHGAIWQPDEITSTRLKAATLLFDQLIFVGKGMQSVAEYILSDDLNTEPISARARKSLSKSWTDNEQHAPKFSIYGDGPGLSKWPWEVGPEKLKQATHSVLQKLYGEDVSEENNYEAYKHGGYVMSDILYWRQHFGSASFIGDKVSEDILRLTSFAPLGGNHSEAKWSETSFPDIAAVSWNDIAELRRSIYLKAFRKKYAELSRAGEAQKLYDHYQETLEQLADAVKPRPKTEMLVGVLGNLPGLMVNPVSVASSARSVHKAFQTEKKFGWVFFLRSLRLTQNKKPKS